MAVVISFASTTILSICSAPPKIGNNLPSTAKQFNNELSARVRKIFSLWCLVLCVQACLLYCSEATVVLTWRWCNVKLQQTNAGCVRWMHAKGLAYIMLQRALCKAYQGQCIFSIYSKAALKVIRPCNDDDVSMQKTNTTTPFQCIPYIFYI